jgi:DNA helicase-2/ATP-dependent DNA helicase PcrA
MDPILDPLNDKQREGVAQTEGAVLVIAGAGSGKTRMITHRFAYLMREKRLGIQNILAVTFTNKAAAEMKERIGSLTNRDATQAWVRTFHSMGALILRRNPDPVGLDRNFVIYDDQDSKNLVKSLMRDMNIGTDMFQPGAISHSISRAKDDLIPPESFQSDGEAYDGS